MWSLGADLCGFVSGVAGILASSSRLKRMARPIGAPCVGLAQHPAI